MSIEGFGNIPSISSRCILLDSNTGNQLDGAVSLLKHTVLFKIKQYVNADA